MKQITRKIYCHLSREGQEERFSNNEIRESDALQVDNFSDLVKHIAYISYHNPEYALFYRAESRDHTTNERLSSLLPSIYRKPPLERPRRNNFKNRFKVLKQAEKLLLDACNKKRLLGISKLNKFREIRWAILQHYMVCDTPLLDITHSLRVACSFALMKATNFPIIFVLGLPHPNGSISYYVEEELLNIRLLSICPPRALRPYFQEGFLIGNLPTSEETMNSSYDAARRLVAKFKLNRSTFVDDVFQPIPETALFPDEDIIRYRCDEIKREVEHYKFSHNL